MEYPMKAFEIIGSGQERIKLEILEVFGFPNETSFRGGYDIRCSLEINVGIYSCRTNNYYAATSALYDFYMDLQNCYDKLNGKAIYSVYYPENDFVLEVQFNQGKVHIHGKYYDNPLIKNGLNFELFLDQSYFTDVLSDLRKIVSIFGDKKGVKN